jgi:hypothetical protein
MSWHGREAKIVFAKYSDGSASDRIAKLDTDRYTSLQALTHEDWSKLPTEPIAHLKPIAVRGALHRYLKEVVIQSANIPSDSATIPHQGNGTISFYIEDSDEFMEDGLGLDHMDRLSRSVSPLSYDDLNSIAETKDVFIGKIFTFQNVPYEVSDSRTSQSYNGTLHALSEFREMFSRQHKRPGPSDRSFNCRLKVSLAAGEGGRPGEFSGKFIQVLGTKYDVCNGSIDRVYQVGDKLTWHELESKDQ